MNHTRIAPLLPLLLIFLGASAGSLHGVAQSSPDTDARAAETGTSANAGADSALRAGYAASRSKDLRAARRDFERAVRLAPRLAAAHSALGGVLLSLGEFPAAVTELETAERLHHGDVPTLLNLCIAYSDSLAYAKSIATYQEIRGASATETVLPADVALAVGTAFSVTGDAAAAETVLQASLASSIDAGQENARLQDAVGTVMAQMQRFDEAEAHLRRAIVIDDGLSTAHFHLGMVAMATGRPVEAAVELTKAHLLVPEAVPYTLQLSAALVASNQETKAIELLRTTLAKLPPSAGASVTELKYRLALALQSAGEAKKALPFFTEVIASRTNDAEALTNTGLAHVQLGDAKAGIQLYLRALELTPSNPTLREDLGVAYLQQADLDHALEQFRAGLAIDDRSPQLHYDLGLAFKLKDDLAAAVPEFERAGELDPTLPDPPYTLGIIYMQQGQFEKAAASLDRATVLRPSQADAWATLGSVYQQMQQPDKAIPALQRAIALAPEQPSPHITLAAILAAQGHKEEAAAERKTSAGLTRAAVNRQKADFGLDSGNLLMKRGQTSDALIQFQSAIEADPAYIPPHIALANALDRAGRKAEAAEERRKAEALKPTTAVPTPQ